MITVSEFVGGAIWRVSQGFGSTSFAQAHSALYAYGSVYGLAKGTHPGIDIGVPIGTRLYSPVAGRVIIAGGNTFFQNEDLGGMSQTGQLKIELDDGTHVIIGHMRSIAVSVGDHLDEKQFIGTSGTANGPHAHVEIRVADATLASGRRCVDPMGIVLDDEPEAEDVRLFRIEVPFLPVRDQSSVTAATAGDYQMGEIAPCDRHVILAEEVEPGERAWGHVAGGHFAGKWLYLGFTKEVRPGGRDGVRYFMVLSDVRNVRLEPDPTSPIVGLNDRGSVLPIAEIMLLNGAPWGRFASGPYKDRWSYIGSNEFSLELT